ncbi:MAG TPA: DUF6285 domain-containing protein [Caulobacteraceae bacterium]
MITSPTSLELIDAVVGFIEQRAAPQLKDRDAFLARVAVNALAAVRREIEFGPQAEAAATARLHDLLGHDGGFSALNAELCDKLSSGELSAQDPQVLAHLKASIIDQVKIDQPNYAGLKILTS